MFSRAHGSKSCWLYTRLLFDDGKNISVSQLWARFVSQQKQEARVVLDTTLTLDNDLRQVRGVDSSLVCKLEKYWQKMYKIYHDCTVVLTDVIFFI